MTLFTPKEKRSIFAAVGFMCLIVVFILLASTGTALASDDLQERHVWFTYGYTECEGTEHPQSDDIVYYADSSETEFHRDYTVNMKSCDTDHVVHAEGDGVTDNNVTYESLNPSVLDIDKNGVVTIFKTGSAQIKATVAADDTYDECSVNLYVKVDKHDAWIGDTTKVHYSGRPQSWGLDLETSDGPQQIVKNLRPGAECLRFESSDLSVAYVDQNGVVTPVSEGQATIIFETDDGGGKYKACSFGNNISITGDDVLLDQKISGDLGRFEIDNYRDGFQLDLHAMTELEYYSIGHDSEYVSVDQNGFVTFTQAASGIIRVVAPPNDIYKPAEAEVIITGMDHQEQLKDRNISFTYGCTECDESVHPCTSGGVTKTGSSSSIEYFTTKMMMCDEDHVVGVTGERLNSDTVTYASLNPDILQIDSKGNVTLKDTGTARIKVTIPRDGTYASCIAYLIVDIDRHEPYYTDIPFHFAGRAQDEDLVIDTSDGSQKIEVPLRPGAGVVSFKSDDPAVASIDKNGVVKPVSAGNTVLSITFDDGGGKYKKLTSPKRLAITVTGSTIRANQKITGNLGPFTIDWHDGLTLDLHAKTGIKYSVSGTGSPSVNSKGVVTFKGKGSATVKAVAAQSKDYNSAEAVIKITARDYAEEKAAKQAAAKKAALKKEIAKAKSLKRPSFKVKARKGHKIKLTWGKVKNADGYVVYVRYPGSKKYIKAVTRKSTVKSVVHKGLSKGRIYRYKVRAFKKVKGKVYYGPYSKVRKAKVK